jgi:subtilisin-like proprotein convertase family protein/subtilisin family serine protease
MSTPTDDYTYRAGKKVLLKKSSDQFVVRALPGNLKNIGISDADQVSSASSRVTTRSVDLEQLMSSARHVAPTHHAYSVADTGEAFLITDRIFVTFREPQTDPQVDAFAGRYALIRKATYSDREFLFQLTDHTGMNPVKLVVKLTEEESEVEAAEHDLNRLVSTSQFVLPSDPSYVRQWHLHTRLSNPAFEPRSSTRCEDAWTLLNDYGSPDVVVGVTDDGCKLDHPDFNSTGKFAGWGYFRGSRLIAKTDIDGNPAEMYKTGSNHGTSCAGVIAAEVDSLLTVGAAPGCRLLPIQWESSGPSLYISDSKMLTVLNYIADKVDVLSNSWCGAPDNIWAQNVVNRIATLAQTGGRRGRGIVFLWAAGNNNCPVDHTASVDVPYDQGWTQRPDGSYVWSGVNTSKRFRNNLVGVAGVMHVAALASTAQRSHYSNYGTGILISAPTSNSHEYYRLTVTGLGIVTTTGEAGGVTEQFGGTSSATPLVAGIAALTISANPDLTAVKVVSILKQTAAKDLNLQGYQRTPAASYDTDTSWDVSPVAPFDKGDFINTGDSDGTWSPWFGHGRVDAAAAVTEALKRRQGNWQQIFSKASTNELTIPDNNSTGVVGMISFAEVATISSVKVTVDLTHTYIGDLRLTLTAPSGTSVVLHDRNGGGARDIRRTFDAQSTAVLGSLVGQSLQGDWMLHVQDLARIDTGTLNRWELTIEGQADAVVELAETPGIVIPDNSPAGVERTLTTAATGQVKGVEVSVDITHSYIGDLTVTLISPAGTSVPLHKREGGSADNIIKTFTPATVSGLQILYGEAIQGDWKLKVAYLAGADVGKLNRWGVKISRQP